jgi:amino-acid N-acetyltransferase
MTATIRQAQAADVPQMVALINRFAAQNIMLPRSEEAVVSSLPNWLVAEVVDPHTETGDGSPSAAASTLVGCGALVALTDKLAEIRSLAVHESQHGQGLGSRLVEHLIALARARAFDHICALTLRENFFVRMGFQVVDRWSISSKLWQECIYCPKFHRCDEIAVFMNLTDAPVEASLADPVRPAAWNHLLKWSAWQPLKLAYNRRPLDLHTQE